MEPLPPEGLYFPKTSFAQTCKLSTRCDFASTLELLEEKLKPEHKQYFQEHPQFRHVFHMRKDDHHRLTHMWFLLLRIVKKKEGKMAWFLVNGVPVRYSIWEHGLITGLNCKEYPENYKDTVGSTRFAIRQFGRWDPEKNPITLEEVMSRFKVMDDGRQKLKMAVLVFLCTVLKKMKTKDVVDQFLIQAVDDLEACHTFPWGRYTFENQLEEIWHTMRHFRGRVQATWMFPGFIFPLAILACEAIPIFKNEYRVPFANDAGCPRMCKWEWRENPMKGWPLSDVNRVLGDTTV